jgi:hypothetical protein
MYIIVVALTILSDFWTVSVVPDVVKELEPSLPLFHCLPLFLLQGIFLISVLAAGLVGFIGLFCFWSPARYIYLVAILLKIICAPLLGSWMVYTGWEELFGELEIFLDGVILTLCLLGPAKHLFEKKEEFNPAFEATS